MAELTAPPIAEWELWACAHALIRQHGNEAPAIAMRRAAELEREGAHRGAVTWRLIAHRVNELLSSPDSLN